ncbi:MAG: TRAP transporter small permease [Chloroflexota bacterium]
MAKWLRRIDKVYSEYFLYKGSRVLLVGGGICLVALMLVTLFTVIARSLPIRANWLVGGYEYSEMFVALLVPLAIGYTWYKAGHVRVGDIRNRLAPRKRAIIDVIACSMGVVYTALVVWGLWTQGMLNLSVGSATPLKELPIGPFQLVIAILFGHVFLVLLRSLVGLVAKAFGSKFANEPYLEGQ